MKEAFEFRIREYEKPSDVFEEFKLPKKKQDIKFMKFMFETDVELTDAAMYRIMKAVLSELESYGFIGSEYEFDIQVDIFKSSNYSVTIYAL